MEIDEMKLNLAKDIVINSSDIETIIAINYLKRIRNFIEELKCNKFNIKALESFIKECIDKYIEIRDIIQEAAEDQVYLFKKDFYLNRLSCIELGIYTHILLVKGKIDDVYDIMYTIK